MKSLREQYGATNGGDASGGASKAAPKTPTKKTGAKKSGGGERTPGSGKRGRKQVKERAAMDGDDHVVKLEDGDDATADFEDGGSALKKVRLESSTDEE